MKYKIGTRIRVKAGVFNDAKGVIREYREDNDSYYVDFEDGFKYLNNVGWYDFEIEE